MAALPDDIADLQLAPVALAIDAKIEQLVPLSAAELSDWIALQGDHPDWTPDLRETGLIQALEHDIDTHGWEVSVDGRGVRLAHGKHSLALGVPECVRAYLAGE